MQVTTNIQIDFTLPGFPETVHAMQQDEKTRYIAISMTEAGVAFTPPSGTLGVLAIRKPDGETCFYDSSNGEPAVTIDGSTATCLLVPEALQVAGDATAALVLYNAQGERLSTFRFLLRIDPTPVLDETVMSSSYYSILTQQIAQALTAAEVAQQVLDMTVSATTLAAGSQATVTKTTSGGVVNLAFGIPQGIQGEQGEQGDAATVAVGTVTTLPPGQSATVTNSGTASAAILNFGIPQGEPGANAIVPTGAGAHNAIYRGKPLGTAVTDAQWAAIKDGTFEDMYIGDYWTIGGVTYRIAAFNYYYNTGDTACTKNHITLVPDAQMYTHVMNDTNITTGAYVGSKMYTEGLTQAKTTINSAFGEAHILNHRQYLQNAVTDGYASGGSWYDSTVELMTEQNVYGGKIFSNIQNGTAMPDSYTLDKSQYPLFTFRPDMQSNRQRFWLRDVVSVFHFAAVYGDGLANYYGASSAGGVRPAFSIYQS